MNDYNTMQYSTTSANPMVNIIALLFIIVLLAGYWKMFTKAGKPGWAAIIPFYNIYVLLKIVKRPGWWLILYFIPFANIVVAIIVGLDLAKVFGKGPVFGIFLNILFQPIGPLILGFGNAKYLSK